MTNPDITIRSATVRDADAVCGIYNPHIRGSIVTFEEIEVAPSEMSTRIAGIIQSFPWLVVEQNGALLGYAYAGNFSDRSAYRHSVFSTIYVDEKAQRKGIGTILYTALLERLRLSNIHVVVGGIALPNAASVALHEKCGFKKVAHLSEVGFKFGRWIDVGYWQIAL
ncbi:MAG TPA: arsinothricin resistance N-acetyltransferase ArsN1 family B [Micropepsaceae bacterium]|nr:arsinothricin resistance N-acetyltransferase ArsN1 family B [Micropepsaceae bacterium]